MSQAKSGLNSPGLPVSAGSIAAVALAFALAFSQSPLCTSNQNQYFLHGTAAAGIGFLSEDWLANIVDPVPVFSLLVDWTCRLLAPWVFYLHQVILLALYLVAVIDLAEPKDERPPSGSIHALFFLLVIGLHSAALQYLLGRPLGPKWEYLFDGDGSPQTGLDRGGSDAVAPHSSVPCPRLADRSLRASDPRPRLDRW